MKITTSNTLCMNIAILLGLACSGCSLLFTRGPGVEPAQVTADTPVECSSSIAPAVLDTVFTATHLGSAAVSGLALPKSAFGGSSDVQTAVVAADLGLAALFAASAIYGYTTSDSCRKAEARADELAAERRSRPPGWEPQQKSGPRVAAGFRFGMSEGAAERVCAGTGRTFRSGDGFHACDGAPPGFAQANSVELKFDTRGLWSIDVVLPASAQWKRSFAQLREGIVKRYGAPVRTNDEVPERCAPEAEAAGCAERGEIKVSTEWQWPDGGRLVLRIPPVPGPLAIRLLYTRPGSTPLQEPRENREPSPEPPIQRATTAP